MTVPQHTRYWLPALLLMAWVAAFPQGTNVEFGKNRVQYHDFTWSYYQSENFVTYYYLGGQEIGKFAARLAEEELPSIEGILDYTLNERIEILVYNDVTDLNMSNIAVGLNVNNIGGVTKIIGNKVFVHFNGNHRDLRRQIREGIGQVLVNNMVFGGSLQEVLQNAVLLNLPPWFTLGLVSYIGERWNEDLDNRLKDGIRSGHYRKFNKLEGEEARLVGHSFWYFIEERNGKEAIPNLLYLTRINRSLENGFLFVLGYTYAEAIQKWMAFYENRYEVESLGQAAWATDNELEGRYFRKRDYRQVRLSPAGDKVAFVTHELGQWRVYLRDIATGNTQTLVRGGFKTVALERDKGYPLLDWDPAGRKLIVFYEKRDVIQMMTYEPETGEKQVRNLEKFQRINSFAFTDNPTRIVMSATNRGQSDIYTMDVRSTTVQAVTADHFDDLQPAWLSFGDRRGIAWVSNRPVPRTDIDKGDSLLPTGTYDVFFLNEIGDGVNQVLRLSNTPSLNERMPLQADSTHFVFLSPQNGIYNAFAGYIDTTFSHFQYTVFFRDSTRVYRNLDMDSWLPLQTGVVDSYAVTRILKDTAYTFPATNYDRSILELDIPRPTASTPGSLALVYTDGRYRMLPQVLPDSLYAGMVPGLTNTGWRQRTLTEERLARIDELTKPGGKPADTPPQEPGFLFQSEFADSSGGGITFFGDEEPAFLLSRVQPYRVKFSTDYVLSQVDNSIIINQYQNFAGYGPVFSPPPVGGLITLSISDLMEDYRFTGGFRIPTTFSGGEYFLKFEDLKHRLDKQVMFYRRSDLSAYDFRPFTFNEVRARQHTNYGELQLRYPIDILRRIALRTGYRHYRVNFLSQDRFSLEIPNYTENWISLAAEYVYDNTFEVMLNILNGTRYRIYYEFQRQFDVQVDPGFNLDLNLGTMHVAGFDIRHYQRLHRQIVWATRFAGATTFGSSKMVYYLGGVDNWLVPRFDRDVEVNFDNGYAFQTLATNMRGFRQNIRNGNSYGVLNTEIRVPVFTYLFNTPIRSELIRNFQAIGFGDIGTAWEGISPFAQDNPFNTEVLERGPVRVSTQYFRNPIVSGFGFGFRTTLFGYFVRLDRAWGIDSGSLQDPLWYLSLSLDF